VIDGLLANLDAITIEDLHSPAIVARVVEAEALNDDE
jgi:hypothetical protein